MNSAKAFVVLSTAANQTQAEELGQALVEKRLAACVSLLPGIQSVYRWQGKIERSSEVLMIAKTTEDLVQELTTELARLHPYETPEILALPVENGFQPYLSWIAEVTSKTEDPLV